VLAFRRLNKVHLAVVFLSNYITAPVRQDEFRAVPAASWAHELESEIEELRSFQNSLLYGSEQLGTPGSVKRYFKRDKLNFDNACPYLPLSEVNRVDEIDLGDRSCETIANGVFTHGLNAAFQYFTDSMSTMLEQLTPYADNANMTRVTQVIRSDSVWELEYLDRSFLRYGLMVDSRMYLSEQLEDNSAFLKLRGSLLAGFLVLVALTYVLVYDPMIRSLDRQLKRVQALLVMVPFDVIQSTVGMKKLLQAA